MGIQFLIIICVPVVYSLNSVVDTYRLIDDGCKTKLYNLLLKQDILIEGTEDEKLREKLIDFKIKLEKVIELVDRHKVKSYKFFFGIDISPAKRTYLVSFIATTVSGIILSVYKDV